MRRTTSLLAAGALGAAGVALVATPASAVGMTITVGTCAGASQTSVQAAVDAATAGDTVALCSGQTFPEQVDITKALTLTSTAGAPGTIKVPSTVTGRNDLVGIHGVGVVVQLSRLDLSGPFVAPVTSFDGLHVYDSAVVTASGLVIDQIRDADQNGRGNQPGGTGVTVGDHTTIGGTDTKGTLTISDSTVSDYQKTGFFVGTDGSVLTSSNVTVAHNETPDPNTGPNGYDIGDAVTVQIQGGSVTGNAFAPAKDFFNDFTGTGVIGRPATGGALLIDGTSFSGNDTGVYLTGPGSSTVTVQNTTTSASRFIGLYVADGTGASFTNNTITGSGIAQQLPDVRDETTGGAPGAPSYGTTSTYVNTTCGTSSPDGICVSKPGPGAVVPEVPLTALLPIGALAALGGVLVVRRRRSTAAAAA